MQREFKKGLKPKIIKYVAMFMGICYLINPLQEQIQTVITKVSNGLDSPTHIIAHNSNSNFGHKSNHHFDDSYFRLSQNNRLVNIISSIFEALNENNTSTDSLVKDISIDKHIVSAQIRIKQRIKIKIVSVFRFPQQKLRCGHFEKMKKPPQHFLI